MAITAKSDAFDAKFYPDTNFLINISVTYYSVGRSTSTTEYERSFYTLKTLKNVTSKRYTINASVTYGTCSSGRLSMRREVGSHFHRLKMIYKWRKRAKILCFTDTVGKDKFSRIMALSCHGMTDKKLFFIIHDNNLST